MQDNNLENNILTKKIEVPYHSQFLEVEDYFWNIRSCGGACIKMVLDYYDNLEKDKIKESYAKENIEETKNNEEIKIDNSKNILEIMNQAFNNGGYDIDNGFVHDFAVNYFKSAGLESYRKENVNFDEVKNSLDKNNPVIVSIIKRTLEQTKYHLIVLVGYEYEEISKEKSKLIFENSSQSVSQFEKNNLDFDVENRKIINIIYHESESTSPDRGSFRKVDFKTFLENWREKAIFVER